MNKAIVKLSIDNIYCKTIDVIGYGKKEICLRIEDLKQDDYEVPVYSCIKYQLALMSNVCEDRDQFTFLLSLRGIELTDFMMDCLGFFHNLERITGYEDVHYDKICTIGSNVNILKFHRNDDNSFSPIVLKEDYSYMVDTRTKISYLHELQEYIRKEYHVSKTFDLSRVNHYLILEKYADDYISKIVAIIVGYKILQLDKIKEALRNLGEYLYPDDMKVLINHGYRIGIFSSMYEYDNMIISLTDRANGLLE